MTSHGVALQPLTNDWEAQKLHLVPRRVLCLVPLGCVPFHIQMHTGPFQLLYGPLVPRNPNLPPTAKHPGAKHPGVFSSRHAVAWRRTAEEPLCACLKWRELWCGCLQRAPLFRAHTRQGWAKNTPCFWGRLGSPTPAAKIVLVISYQQHFLNQERGVPLALM